MDPDRLRWDLPVGNTGDEAFGDEESGVLLPGHPGRVTDDSPWDVGVEWFGVEDKPVSTLHMYDYKGFEELDEAEYEERVGRMKRGLPPVE